MIKKCKEVCAPVSIVLEVGRQSLVFNAQSTMSVISSGRNTIHQITNQSLDSSKHFAVFVLGGLGENEVELNEPRLEALVVGKACSLCKATFLLQGPPRWPCG